MIIDKDAYPVFVQSRANSDYAGITKRLADPINIDLNHAAMGVSTEAGEILDIIKKHIYYGKDIDTKNLIEELGDIIYYIQLLINTLNIKNGNTRITLDSVIWDNIKKLTKRYPNGFSESAALNRDIDNELSHIQK